jgi:hypothetical protein
MEVTATATRQQVTHDKGRSLFVDDMMFCTGNPKRHTQNELLKQ